MMTRRPALQTLLSLAAVLAPTLLGCGAPAQRPGWPSGSFDGAGSAKASWSETPRPWIIAHRASGMAGSPRENALPDLRRAVLEGGAVGVEVDVALTADGEVVLMHDHDLQRTTSCSGCVSQLTLAEIAACEIEPSGDGARPPSLGETLATLADLPVVPLLMLDVKADPWRDDCPPVGGNQTEHLNALGRGIGRALRDGDYAQNTGIQARYPEILTAARALAPQATLLALADQMGPAVLAARESELDGVAVWEDGMTEAWVREAHRAGFLIDTFTVNAPIDLATAVSSDVDVIESDYVPELLAWFD